MKGGVREAQHRHEPARAEGASGKGRLVLAVVLLILAVVGVYREADVILAPPPATARAPTDARAAGPGTRTFMLFIDSLPLGATRNVALMPELGRFKRQARWMASSGATDQVTNPALLAAFVGADRFRIFGFVENFVQGRDATGSIVDDWRRAGRKILVYSDDAFLQFGKNGIDYRRYEEPKATAELEPKQHALFARSLEEFRSGAFDIVIFHATFVDTVAHRVRHDGSEYRSTLSTADRWIGEAARAVAPGETLIVFGDHGHNDRGVHAAGLDVPTFIGVRGPGFSRGREEETQPITVLRYLASWATGVPLAAEYEGPRLPHALLSPGPLPTEFGAANAPPARRDSRGATALALAAGALLALWVLGAWSGFGVFELGGLAAGIGLLLITGWHPYNAWAATAAAGVALGLCLVYRRTLRELAWAVAAGVLTAAMVAHGHWMATHVLTEQTKEFSTLRLVLPIALTLGTVAAVAFGPGRACWAGIGAALLLLPTTCYAWGAMSLWAAELMLVALCFGLVGLAARHREGGIPAGAVDWVSHGIGLVLVGWIVQRYAFSNGFDFVFRRWDPWSWLLAATGPVQWRAGSFLAKVLLLFHWQRKPTTHAVSFFGLGLLSAYEWGLLPRESPWTLLVAAGLLAAAFVARARAAGRLADEATSDVLLLTALLLAFFFMVRTDRDTHYWLNLSAAALSLCARMMQPLRPELRQSGHALLLCFGVVISGWVDTCWSTGHLEWEFLSSVFSAELIRSHVVLFLPALVGRYLLPLFVIRAVLRRQLGPESIDLKRIVLAAWGLKTLTVAAQTVGVGLAHQGSGFFLEGLHHTAILLILGLGLIGTQAPGLGPAAASETSLLFGAMRAAWRRGRPALRAVES